MLISGRVKYSGMFYFGNISANFVFFWPRGWGERGWGNWGCGWLWSTKNKAEVCNTFKRSYALQVSTLAMAWFFMPCNVFYAVYRWAYFSFGTNMHWTLEKRGKRNIFPSFGCKTLTHSSQEFEYWRKYFQPLNPFSNFISSANCISPVGAKGSHRDVGISLI